MAGQHFLHVPGPTPVPERVQRAMMTIEDHRGPRFPALVGAVTEGLRPLLGTRAGHIALFPSSGTGAWEASIQNTLSPGDRVLVARHGAFSTLWAAMCERMQLEVTPLETAWGQAAPVEGYATALECDRAQTIKAVLVCHNETSTGVVSDIGAIRRAMDRVNHSALLLVDAVSSVACMPFQMDEWGVDVVVSASQKGLMVPPGLSIVGVSDKALRAHASASFHRTYFDLQLLLETMKNGRFPYTPPVSLLHGLRESLIMIAQEGLDARYRRHQHLARGVQQAVDAWGLSLCASDTSARSPSVSTIMVPEQIDANEIVSIAHDRYDLALGGGLMALEGRAFRIGHMGDVNELMCLAALCGAEMAMHDAGLLSLPAGAGVAAATEQYRLKHEVLHRRVA